MAMILRINGSWITPPPTGAGVVSPIGVIFKMDGGLKLLRMHSGINLLEVETALKDDRTPSNAELILGSRPGEMRHTIISIFCNEGPSFKKRPSQEQVDRLSEILGKQPRWWVDSDDPASYYGD